MLTHLSDFFLRAAEVEEGEIDKVVTAADGYCLLLQRVLRAHGDDLPQLRVLEQAQLLHP